MATEATPRIVVLIAEWGATMEEAFTNASRALQRAVEKLQMDQHLDRFREQLAQIQDDFSELEEAEEREEAWWRSIRSMFRLRTASRIKPFAAILPRTRSRCQGMRCSLTWRAV